MSSVYQRLMSDGQWEITLSPDTPRAILDQLKPFTCHIVITPSELDPTISDAGFLAAARYVGPVRRIGKNRLSPGGPGNAMWLSDPDGKGDVITNTAVTLSAGSLSSWITTLLPSALSAGTVTSPGGTYSNTYQWVSRRQAIDSVCRAFGVEWRVNNDFTLDVGTVANLYRSAAAGETPAAVVARGFGGRDTEIVGVRSDVAVDVDWDDHVTQVFVIGQGSAFAGPVLATFKEPDGGSLFWKRVVLDPTAPPGSLGTVAQSIYDQLPHDDGHREVRISTDLYDIAGDVTLGDDVYVWDPENGLVDTSNQVPYQGQLIYPTAMRLIGIRWPVRRGMGVYLRTSSLVAATYINLTPYVEFDESAATLELGAASRRLATDSAGQLVTATGPVGATPWLTYTPSITGTGTAVGNGTVSGWFRREGTTLHLRIRWTLGSTSTVGSGGVTFSLPSGVTAVSGTNINQMCHAMFNDTGTAVYEGHAYVGSGGTTLQCNVWNVGGTYPTWAALSATVPHTWANTDFINVNGTLEVQP